MSRVNQFTDPRTLEAAIQRNPAHVPVVGLDLGTNCGVTICMYRPGDPPVMDVAVMGQLDLSAGGYESGAIRFVKLRHYLQAIRPAAVFYEDVKSQPAGIGKLPVHAIIARIATASEFLGALKATVCAWCEEHHVPCSGFAIGAIKRHATGRGNCGKEEMITACNAAFGTELEVEGYESTGADNLADSAFVCRMGLEQYAGGLLHVPAYQAESSGQSSLLLTCDTCMKKFRLTFSFAWGVSLRCPFCPAGLTTMTATD